MYSHSFAVVFLAALHHHSPTDEVKKAITSAVRLIEGAQNDEGGWRYNPVPYDADVSVTSCQVVALRAAANAGVPCNFKTIERAEQFILRCQNPNGGFRYQLDDGPSGPGRSAAAQAALLYIGQGGDKMARGLAYLEQWQPHVSHAELHAYYFQYYATQVMWQAGGSVWAKWWPALRQSLVDAQQNDGAWKDQQLGPEYATAIGLIVLQFPTGTLPMLPPVK